MESLSSALDYYLMMLRAFPFQIGWLTCTSPLLIWLACVLGRRLWSWLFDTYR